MKKIVLTLLLILIIAGCNKNGVSKSEIENNNQPENEQVVESVTSINTNSKYQEEKIIDGILFKNASLVQIDENCLFEVTLKNQNPEVYKFEYVNITLLDNNNNKVIELSGLVTNGILNPNEEKIISSYYNGGIKNIYDIRYEIIK